MSRRNLLSILHIVNAAARIILFVEAAAYR